MIVDTSALLAYFNDREPDHAAVADVIDNHDGQLVISPYAVAELDCLIAKHVGVDAELAVLRELASGAWELAVLGPAELELAASIVEKYRDQHIGVTDASLVVLADQKQTRTIVTLDHRHFDVLRPIGGGRFSIRP